MRFPSILFERPGAGVDGAGRQAPGYFGDLNLDQVFDAMTQGREEYDLGPFFYAPLHDVESVYYRHEVLRDLEEGTLLAAIEAFARAMRTMRHHLAQADKLRYARQTQRWFLDAVDVYCTAVGCLSADLTRAPVASRGLRALREYLAAYTAGDAFTALVSETRARLDELAAVRYCVHDKGSRVHVTRYDDEADLGAVVQDTFARFKQNATASYLVEFHDGAQMNHVEAQVLDLVARLYPDAFGSLQEYCARHRGYLDATIGAFDRQVQFYLAYLEFTAPLKSAGLSFCYPQVSGESKQTSARDAFDLALAAKLAPESRTVVPNSFFLGGPQRVLVVTGPNQGGKTTFARMVGQLHHLAALGYPVPGTQARLLLPDRIFTHFEREEDLGTLRGRLEDELVRIHEILQRATGDSVVIMNESFSSTTLADALFLGTRILRRIIRADLLCVCVTFVDELASLSESTVSMVGSIAAGDPASRTYKIERGAPDGLAYAAAIAEKYGLTSQLLQRRIAP